MRLDEWLKTAPALGLYLEQGYDDDQWYATLYRIGAEGPLTPAYLEHAPAAERRTILDVCRRTGLAFSLTFTSDEPPCLATILNFIRMDALEEQDHVIEPNDHVRFKHMLGSRYWMELVYSVDVA